jgi:hypothetical protein
MQGFIFGGEVRGHIKWVGESLGKEKGVFFGGEGRGWRRGDNQKVLLSL